MTPNPCPKCRSAMEARTANACSASGEVYNCHFLVCAHCGYGPNQAFDTMSESIAHWNYHSQVLNITQKAAKAAKSTSFLANEFDELACAT